MAQIEDSRKGGRATNVEVNIVPFIDLMSVLVIFLLITAVWSQVSMIQLGSSIYGKQTSDKKTQPPPRAEVAFRLDILDSGQRVVIGKNEVMIPKVNGQYDMTGLETELKKVKEIYPDKLDCVITMQDSLAYENLINGMDALLQAGFPQIAISTSGVAQ